jgi:restriction system protein
MIAEMLAPPLQAKLVQMVVGAVRSLPRHEARAEAAAWFRHSAAILAERGDLRQKALGLVGAMGQSGGSRLAAGLLEHALRDLSDSALPRPLKAALPVTLMSMPLFGGQGLGLGLAALGGLLGGLPAVALILLGSVGLSAVLDSLAEHEEAASTDAEVRPGRQGPVQARAQVPAKLEPGRAGPYTVPRPLVRQPMPTDEELLRRALRDMDPFEFECHVMSFFAESGMEAWVTGKTNDMGVDGFARHPRGLIVVQCKRHGSGNLVGRPVIQQMKGVVAEHDALCGYLVTTSSFSDKARQSAKMSGDIILVDLRELIRWHREAPRLSA